MAAMERFASVTKKYPLKVGLHEPLHGSSLFQRGQTQVKKYTIPSIEDSLNLSPVSCILFHLIVTLPGSLHGSPGQSSCCTEVGCHVCADRRTEGKEFHAAL